MVLDLFHLVIENTSNTPPHYTLLSLIIMIGLNIEVTPKQYDYLYDVLMEAYSNDVAEQKDWDVQTFDNLIDNVCDAKSTNLSSHVKGVL